METLIPIVIKRAAAYIRIGASIADALDMAAGDFSDMAKSYQGLPISRFVRAFEDRSAAIALNTPQEDDKTK